MSSPQEEEGYYRDFVASFTPEEHPEIAFFTGGEPMLRPRLVRELAESCHRVGVKTVLTTGLYFGRHGRIADNLWPTLESMDFVTVSIDEWHEKEISREASFACFEQMLARGLSVGVQATGQDRDDPYLRQLLDEIEAAFGTRIGVYVGLLKPAGRGIELTSRLPAIDEANGRPRPQGCGGLSWPVFGSGGPITNACCNQEAVNTRPDHLNLPPTWPAMIRALREDPVLRVINVLGPRMLAYELDGTSEPATDFCGKCRSLAGRSGLAAVAQEMVDRPSWGVMEAVTLSMREELGDPTLGQKEFATYTTWGDKQV